MEVCKNVSGQPLVLILGKGKVVQLLTDRAVTLTETEQKSAQVQALISRGALRLVKLRGTEKQKEIIAVKTSPAEIEKKEPLPISVPKKESKKK